MTEILLCSDLHTNFHRDGGKSTINGLYEKDVDVVVVAGDLSIVTNNLLQENIRDLCDKYPEVVFVAGNHEYYHSSFPRVDGILADLQAELSNFTWLNNDRVEIAGQMFIGATLWFPDSVAAQINKKFLNDYRCITNFEPEVYNRYAETIDFFENNMEAGDVVVTHHMPSYRCVDLKFKKSTFNCFFACRLDALIAAKKPAAWLYGHTHFGNSFMYGPTNLAGNPMGYPGENPFFSDSFTVKV